MMSIHDALPYITVLIALAGFVYARIATHKSDGATLQRVADKLDAVGDTTRETRDDVRDIKRTLDDHSNRLARLEERANDHGRRLEKLESKTP